MYIHMHQHWKPLHPLCSWSGYGLGLCCHTTTRGHCKRVVLSWNEFKDGSPTGNKVQYRRTYCDFVLWVEVCGTGGIHRQWIKVCKTRVKSRKQALIWRNAVDNGREKMWMAKNVHCERKLCVVQMPILERTEARSVTARRLNISLGTADSIVHDKLDYRKGDPWWVIHSKTHSIKKKPRIFFKGRCSWKREF